MQKAIFQQFGSKCPFCNEREVATLQIHHIEPYADVQEHTFENLLLVCASCHEKVGEGIISLREVHRAKFIAEQSVSVESDMQKSLGQQTVMVSGNNHGMVANNISVTSPRTSFKTNPMAGTIAADYKARNYAKYLIDKYNTFKEAEVGKGRVKYAILYKSIEREFGAKWDNLPVENLETLVNYLHNRIDSTRLGKTHKSQGRKNYSSFQEHVRKITDK